MVLLKPRLKLSTLDRSIMQRERGIKTAKVRIAAIRDRANIEIAKIEKSIQRSNILLDALKAGTLKP